MNNASGGSVIQGSGRYQGQDAVFLVAAGTDGATLWSVRTADGRVETAWSDDTGAEGMSWGSGIRYPLELEDRELHVRVARAITGIERPPGRADLAMATAAGPLRLLLDRDDAFALTLAGQSEWEFSVDSVRDLRDWPALRQSIAASVTQARAEWRSAMPVSLETRVVAASGHLLARIAVDGVDGWFILDTGATDMVLLPEFARRAGSVAAGSRALTSIAGVELATVVHLESVDVGSLRLVSNTATVSEALAGLPATIGDTVDGIIGAHVFARAVVTLDLEAGTTTVAPSAPQRDHWLPVRVMNLHALIPAQYEGRSDLFRLDTGAVPGLMFHYGGVRRRALLDGRETTALPGDLGALELRVGKVANVTVAGVTIPEVDACFVAGGADILADEHTVGVIGIPVLRALGELTLDLPGRRVAVRPRG